MRVIREVVSGLIENFKASLRWASVQMMAFWGMVWVIYSQLPPDVMIQLAQTKVEVWKLSLNVPTFMALLQATMTYLARVKQPKVQ